jgi:hypothetical protein
MRNDDFSQKSPHSNYLIGGETGRDTKLTTYLQHYSANNKIHPGTDNKILTMSAADFIAELASRWQAAQAKSESTNIASAPTTVASPLAPKQGAVFISFASENTAIARRMAEDLTQAGIEVWFDGSDLRPGNAWALSIERGIEYCALFLPIISQASVNPDHQDRYFWREWRMADDIASGHGPDLEFIMPVIVDDTQFESLKITMLKTFAAKQATRLPNGEITPEFAHRLQLLQRDYRRRKGQQS